MRFDSVCVLGGAGLVGYQVCRSLLKAKVTARISVVSLYRPEVDRAVQDLRGEFPGADVIGRYGNVFARGRLADIQGPEAPPVNDRKDPARRRKLLSDIYESFDEAREHSSVMASDGHALHKLQPPLNPILHYYRELHAKATPSFRRGTYGNAS